MEATNVSGKRETEKVDVLADDQCNNPGQGRDHSRGRHGGEMEFHLSMSKTLQKYNRRLRSRSWRELLRSGGAAQAIHF